MTKGQEVASQDPESPEYAEETEGKITPSSKAGSAEIDQTAKDERFSKSHEIDEETLRKNKQKNAPSGR